MPKKIEKPSKDELIKKYWGKQYSLKELSGEYDVSVPTVSLWFDYYDIELRDQTPASSYPFGGDVDDAVRLLKRRDDLLIRLCGNGHNCFKLVYDDGSFYLCRRSHQDDATRIDEDSKLLASYFDSYDAKLDYRSEFKIPL